MKIWGTAALEKAVRAARDRYIVGPLARSRLIQRHAHFGYDYSVKVVSDHVIAYNPRETGALGAHLKRQGVWCRDEFRTVLSVLASQGRTTKHKVFVDVGANVGTQTIYALISDDFASAVAIEPQPDNLAILQIKLTRATKGGDCKFPQTGLRYAPPVGWKPMIYARALGRARAEQRAEIAISPQSTPRIRK